MKALLIALCVVSVWAQDKIYILVGNQYDIDAKGRPLPPLKPDLQELVNGCQKFSKAYQNSYTCVFIKTSLSSFLGNIQSIVAAGDAFSTVIYPNPSDQYDSLLPSLEMHASYNFTVVDSPIKSLPSNVHNLKFAADEIGYENLI